MVIKKKLENIKIKDLKEYPNNAKIHTSEQISEIRDSIIALDDLDPIQVDEDNIILCGHGRLKAYWELDSTGEKEIEIIRLSGMSEGQKKAWRIANNKFTMKTGWDMEKLGKEFNLLEDTDFFGDTGFGTSEISDIWDKKDDSSSILDSEKTTVIEHTCPECGHNWEQEIKKSNKRQ